jgi:hypothetical protein
MYFISASNIIHILHDFEGDIYAYKLCMGKYDDGVFWRVDGPSVRGPSATKNEVIIFSHTKSITFLLYTFNFV